MIRKVNLKQYERKTGLYLNGNRILLRAVPQQTFERRVLMATANRVPAYSGYFNRDGNDELTFVECEQYSMPNRINKIIKEIDGGGLSQIGKFTSYPMIIGIDSHNYLDRIAKSTTGEGLIITGKINLDDIEIFRSLGIDRIDYMFRGLPEEKRMGIKSNINESISAMNKRLLSKMTLVELFDKNPEEAMVWLTPCVYGATHLGYTQEQKDKVIYFVNKLREFYSRFKSA